MDQSTFAASDSAGRGNRTPPKGEAWYEGRQRLFSTCGRTRHGKNRMAKQKSGTNSLRTRLFSIAMVQDT